MSFPKKALLTLCILLTLLMLPSCVTDERTYKWKEDIIYFRDKLLSSHPIFNDNSESYDADVYNDFNKRVDELITNIPQLEDYQIGYGLREISASLKDSHTNLYYYYPKDNNYMFPFEFRWHNDGAYTRVVWVKEYAEALLCKLVAINGIDIDEIFNRMERVIGFENIYYFRVQASLYICTRAALQYLGIIGDENTADFTFLDSDGQTFTLTANTMKVAERGNEEFVGFDAGFYKDSHPMDEYYWCEYLPDDDAFYVRYRECEEMPSKSLRLFLMTEVLIGLDRTGAKKLIFDVRGNPGGLLNQLSVKTFINGLNQRKISSEGSIYVLMDDRTFSGGVITASLLKQGCENVVLVGEPTGNPPNFFGGTMYKVMPNSGIGFFHSTRYFYTHPGNEELSLMPDIYIPATFEDYINSYDRVLEEVLGY